MVIVAAVVSLAGALASCGRGCIAAPTQTAPSSNWVLDPATRVQDWQEDITYFAEQLPERHINAFFKCQRDDFVAAASALRSAVPELRDYEVVVGLMKLAAMVGDSHTGINVSELHPPLHSFPLSVYVFKDGPVIVAAKDSDRSLIGCKLVRFGGIPTDEAFRRISVATAYENTSAFKDKAPRLLACAEIAQSVGLITTLEEVEISVSDPQGLERSVLLKWMYPGEKLATIEADESQLPLSRRKHSHRNWYESLSERPVLYFRYNTCADEPGQSVAELSAEILGAIDTHKIERVIVDLRSNGGGNSGLLASFIHGLKARRAVNRKGGVIVLIGRNTFSSAHMNAVELQKQVAATLIGEPTGQKPNAYGEVRSFTLPHSGISVRYSTKFWRTEPGDRPSLDPDILVEISSTDYFALKDPAFEAALAYQPQ